MSDLHYLRLGEGAHPSRLLCGWGGDFHSYFPRTFSSLRGCQAKTLPAKLTHSPQSKFSLDRTRDAAFNLAKIDVAVFASATSRVVSLATTGNNPIENLPRKSLSHKILSVSHWRSRFCHESSSRNHANYNESNILAKTGGEGGTLNRATSRNIHTHDRAS
jgi:hypothetical protein